MSFVSAVFGSFGMHLRLPDNPRSMRARDGLKARGPPKRAPRCSLLTRGGLSRVAKRFEVGTPRQVAQGRLLDLPGPLGGDAEPATGVAERGRSLSTEAEPQAHNVALALGKLGDRLLDGLLAHARGDLGVGLGLLIRHQVTERRVAVVADGLV